jgi:hypothetical protein
MKATSAPMRAAPPPRLASCSRNRTAPATLPGGLHMAAGEWRLFAAVLILTSAVRPFRNSKPNSVVFAEVYLGKFAARYIKTRYFVDIHLPPLLSHLPRFYLALTAISNLMILRTVLSVPYRRMR